LTFERGEGRGGLIGESGGNVEERGIEIERNSWPEVTMKSEKGKIVF
jgi:hypothetical protein